MPLSPAYKKIIIGAIIALLLAGLNNCEKLGLCPGPLEVRITYPPNLGVVEKDITVLGTINKELASNEYLWLLVGFADQNMWWPQGNHSISPSKERWDKNAVINIKPKEKQNIEVILVDEKVDKILTEWWDKANRTNNWSPIKLPSGTVMDRISVIKGQEDPEAKLTDPHNGQTVNNSIIVRGTIDGMIPDKKYLWLLVGLKKEDQWWPQTGNIIPDDQNWKVPAKIGSGPNNLSAGLKYNLVAILVDDVVNRGFNNRIKEAKYPPIEFPSGKILDEISVIKGIG
jgi:hypothetical protein